MIRLISEINATANRALLDEMFRARGYLFGNHPGRDTSVDARGREADRFDTLAPVNLVMPDHEGHHLGSLRLLPTTGETVLQDEFRSIFDGLPITSPKIWECTRFCVGRGDGGDLALSDTRRVTSHLLLGLCETALTMKLSKIAGAFDSQTLQAFGKSGWSPDILGQSGDGEDAVYLGMWDVGKDHVALIRAASGITGPVMKPDLSRPHRSGVA